MILFKRRILYFLAVMAAFTLSACQTTADLAMKSFEQGDYIASVAQYADYANRRGEQISDKKRQEFQTIVHHSVGLYEQRLAETPTTAHAQRIIQLAALKSMRTSLSAPIHRLLVPDVVQRLDASNLAEALANQYYLLGKSIKGTQPLDYQQRAEAYQNALKQVNPYKDSQALFTSNDKTYKGFLAEELYQAGLAQAKAKDYQTAAYYLNQIAAVYTPYGHYKNTATLLTQYETLWRTAAYKTLMQQADASAAHVNSKRSARAVAAQYQQAVNTLSTYGDSKQAQQKATKYQQQGWVQVFVDDDSSPLMNSISTSQASAALTLSPLQPFLRLTRDKTAADIVVKIRLKEQYERDGDAIDRTAQTLQVRTGEKTITRPDGTTATEPTYTTKRFTKVTTTAENRYITTVAITFSGLYQEKLSHTFTASSERKVVSYEGDVPSGKAYDKKEVSTLKSKDTLAKDSRQKAGSDLHSRLYNTAVKFDAL